MSIHISVSTTFSEVFTDKPRDITADEYLAEPASLRQPAGPAARTTAMPRSRQAEYVADLGDLYGLDDSAAPAAVISRSYGEMAARVLEGCGAGAEPVDLMILAYTNTEFFTLESAGSFLVDVFPSTKTAFAVTEQGRLAPFTALQLAKGFLGEKGFEKAAVVAIEQSAVPLISDHDAEIPVGDVAAAILMTRGTAAVGDGGLSVVLRKVGGQARLGQLVREILNSEMAALGCTPLIVIGDHIPIGEVASLSPHVHRAVPGRVCTGVWEALDRYLRSDGRYSGPILVAEYDPMLDHLGGGSVCYRPRLGSAPTL